MQKEFLWLQNLKVIEQSRCSLSNSSNLKPPFLSGFYTWDHQYFKVCFDYRDSDQRVSCYTKSPQDKLPSYLSLTSVSAAEFERRYPRFIQAQVTFLFPPCARLKNKKNSNLHGG